MSKAKPREPWNDYDPDNRDLEDEDREEEDKKSPKDDKKKSVFDVDDTDYFSEAPPKPAGKAKAKVEAPDDDDDDDDEDEDEGDEEEEVEEEVAPPKSKAKPKSKPKPADSSSRKVISLDGDRGLTKKAKQSLEVWNGRTRGKQLDSLVKAHIGAARSKFGHSGVFHGTDTENLVIGIPIPALAFEWVIGQDVFPLGLIMQIVAKHGTGKSGLLAEIGRWFDMAGGITVLNENETKFSPHWYESIMGQEAYNRMQLNRCSSVESWQRHLTFDIQSEDGYKKTLLGTKKEPGPGRTVPILFGVDSVMGKMSELSQELIRKEGMAGRGYPVEALIIARYMRTLPQWIDGWPFSVVLINHLSLKQNADTHQEERHKGGGVLINFQESFEIELRKVGPKRFETQEYEGFYLDIDCAKNSFGPTHRTAKVKVVWWEEPDDDGSYRQVTKWDWDWATTNLLCNIMTGDKHVRMKKHLKDVDFHMEFKSPTSHSAAAWSRTLGVPQKQPLSFSDMGEAIRNSPEVTDRLRQALRIRRRPLLEGDYLKQMTRLAGEMP